MRSGITGVARGVSFSLRILHPSLKQFIIIFSRGRPRYGDIEPWRFAQKGYACLHSPCYYLL